MIAFLIGLSTLASSALAADGPTACDAIKAEALRRQRDELKKATTAAFDADAENNVKHKPFLRIEGTTAIVVVGIGAVTGKANDLIHPMKYSEDANVIHWIDTIWIEDQNDNIIGMRTLSPHEEAPASFSISIPEGTLWMTAYEHCNKHGTFKGQTILVDAVQTVPGLQAVCNLFNCSNSTAAPACPAYLADFERRHADEFTKSEPVNGNDNLKHKPSVIVHGNGSATVIVGHENKDSDGDITYHPMKASDDPNQVHWINSVWVVDQDGAIIVMQDFQATDPSPATVEFSIPAGTTKIVAYEYCNKHGLFKGDDIPIGPGQASSESLSAEACSFQNCPSYVPLYARGTDCASLVADAYRRQMEFHRRSAVSFPVPYALGTDNEKHNPYIVLRGTSAMVVVGRGAATGEEGDPIHPMSGDPSDYGAKLHWIDTIWVEDQDGEVLAYRSLGPQEAPPAGLHFEIPEGTTKLRAYEFCNTHGLFQGSEVFVYSDNILPGARSGCSVQQCIEGNKMPSCEAYTAEFYRRLDVKTGKDDPTGKHKPYLWVNGTMATIVVGIGATPEGSGLIHPMSPSDDPNVVHFISHIFAIDEYNNLVALCELLPTEPAPASCTFQIPAGVQSLRPFEFCNKHGLYAGTGVNVKDTNQVARRTCTRRECTESHPTLIGMPVLQVSPPSACDALRSEMLRRQRDERKEATTSPYDADALNNRKHKPFLRIEGRTGIVVVGQGAVTRDPDDPIHPMKFSTNPDVIHWIDTIWVEDHAGVIIGMRRLSPQEASPASFAFSIPEGTKWMTAYQHCNLHGTFKGQTLLVDAVQTVTGLRPVCNLVNCSSIPDADIQPACTGYVSDYDRLHAKEFGRNVPVDGNSNLKHKPSLILNGNGSASVIVGHENIKDGNITYHPMQASDDVDKVHWINSVWVVDQTGSIVAMRDFLATEPSPATLHFMIPSNATSLTAYEYCNKHGLFKGDETPIDADQKLAGNFATCGVRECRSSVPLFATGADCVSMIANAYRRQVEFNDYSPAAFPKPYALGKDNEKHNPYIVLQGTTAKVVVGKGAATGVTSDPIHPMSGDPSNFGENLHYIDTIWVEDQDGNLLAYRTLSPVEEPPAELYFDIPEGTTKVQAYEFCNTHGLFQGDEVMVTPANTRSAARAGCSAQQCVEGTAVSACQAFTAEFHRRMGSQTGKDDSTGKHKPYMWINGTTATIVVGQGATPNGAGGLIHPMSPSSDPLKTHWIEYIFARDELNNLVALCELLPTQAEPATCTFEVPVGVQFMRPFEYCNKHGLYVGEVVQVSYGNPLVSRMCQKRECTESQPSLSSAPLTSTDVEAMLQSSKDSTKRINTINMCLQHILVFVVSDSAVDNEMQALINQLTKDGDAKADVAARLQVYPQIFNSLKNQGGKWHGIDVALEHTGVENETWRHDLINEEMMRFSNFTATLGQELSIDGLGVPVVITSASALVIVANFEMDWGHTAYKKLGPHYTMFYTANFTSEVLDVALCGKTMGWMGIGWLNPNKDTGEHPMLNTDMNVAFVGEDGVAEVQDRFAKYIEEPMRDEVIEKQTFSDGKWNNGVNDLHLRQGALGVEGKEWCPDSDCDVGFTIVQYTRTFRTPDRNDTDLPTRATKVPIIFSFATLDPTASEMVQHVGTSTGYADLPWNLECPPGEYFNVDTTECISCDPGRFRPAAYTGFNCPQCPTGMYQDETGQAACKYCKAGFTTVGSGASEERACMCSGPTLQFPDGTYHSDSCDGGPLATPKGEPLPCSYLGHCLECPEGMSCSGGRELVQPTPQAALDRIDDFCASFVFSQSSNCTSRTFCMANLEDPDCMHSYPVLKRGYWSSESDKLRVFACHATKRGREVSDVCLGGRPGPDYCADREGRSCAVCKGDAAIALLAKMDGCRECKEADIISPIIMALMGFGALTCTYIFANDKISVSAGNVFVAAASVGSLAVCMMSIAVLPSLSISMPSSVSSPLKVVGVILLDFGAMRLECIGIEPGFPMWLCAMCIPPVVPLYFIFGYFFLHLFRCCRMTFDKIVNTCAHIMLALFTPMVFTVTTPFSCYSNPAGPGQVTLHSMVKYPQVLCFAGEDGRWSTEYLSFFLLGIAGVLFYLASFFAFLIYLVQTAPYQTRSNSTFKVTYRFMIYKFKPDRYFWAFVMLVRSILIAVTPAITPDNPYGQLCFMAAVLTVALVMQCVYWPWTTQLLNLLDALGVACALMLAVVCFTFADTPQDLQKSNEDVAQVVVFSLIALLVISSGAVILDAIVGIIKQKGFGMQPKSLLRRRAKSLQILTHLREELSCTTDEQIEWFCNDISESDFQAVVKFTMLMETELYEEGPSYRSGVAVGPFRYSLTRTTLYSESTFKRIRMRPSMPEELLPKRTPRSQSGNSGYETPNVVEEPVLEKPNIYITAEAVQPDWPVLVGSTDLPVTPSSLPPKSPIRIEAPGEWPSMSAPRPGLLVLPRGVASSRKGMYVAPVPATPKTSLNDYNGHPAFTPTGDKWSFTPSRTPVGSPTVGARTPGARTPKSAVGLDRVSHTPQGSPLGSPQASPHMTPKQTPTLPNLSLSKSDGIVTRSMDPNGVRRLLVQGRALPPRPREIWPLEMENLEYQLYR